MFEEGRWLEGQKDSTSVTLEDDDPLVLEAVLDYFYTFHYEVPESVFALVFYVNVFKLANKYQSDALENLAYSYLSHTLVIDEWSDEHLFNMLRAIEDTFGSTGFERPDWLAAEHLQKRLSRLLKSDEFIELLHEKPHWAVFLLKETNYALEEAQLPYPRERLLAGMK